MDCCNDSMGLGVGETGDGLHHVVCSKSIEARGRLVCHEEVSNLSQVTLRIIPRKRRFGFVISSSPMLNAGLLY